LKQAVKKDAGNADALWELAVLYDRNLQLPDKAAQTYKRFKQLFPNDPRATDKAVASKQPETKPVQPPVPPPPPARKMDARSAQEALTKGVQMYNAKDWDGAIASYKRALEFDNESADMTLG
jgi:tetratricopeptide (TPR) repeat protein